MNIKKQAVGILAALALTTLTAQAQTSTTISGKIVDLATYITHDHNMSAMQGDAMKGDAMHDTAMKDGAMADTAMKGDAMSSCPATLGLVTAAGHVYLLATQMGSARAQALCKELGQTASLSGAVFSQGGMTALLVK